MLRENRRLPIPVQSAITDLAGLRYWAHPGVDLHYVTHPESIEEVEKLAGPGSVEWMRPPISRDFLMPRTRSDARAALDVPAHARLVLVSGGGWGIGDLERRDRSRARGEDTLVVCITGRNEVAREKLEQRFADNEQVRILGFTEQMSDWMAAADAMIHATAGLTVLEAHIRGCPVVSYGFSAGHLRANNAAFERFGLAEVARSEHELESVLRHLTRERRSPDSSFASLPSIASRVLTRRARGSDHSRSGACAPGRLRPRSASPWSRSRCSWWALSVVDWETPYRVFKSRSRSRRRIHFGKDEQRSLASSSSRGRRGRASTGLTAGAPQPQPLIAGLAGAGGLAAAAVAARRARPSPRSCPVSARRWGSPSARTGAAGVALTFDDGPHPQGTPAGARDAARGGRTGDLLPRRRAGRAAPGAGR